jgi:uncharacterized protein DUF992
MSVRAKTLAVGAALALGMAASLAGNAEANGVKAGFLKCEVAGNLSFIFGSSRDISCIYDAGTAYPLDHYKGTIKKYGVDIGYQQNGVIIWGVVAPSNYVGPGALAGDYGGVSAAVAVGLGVGANALIGGSNNTVALQPLSVEGMQGLNVAGGIGVLTLVHAQ